MDDLVRGLQAGDPSAFERLVREHGDALYRFARRMAGDRWAEDLVQETFLRVHRSVGSYVPEGSFGSWLFSIANNVCIDHLRRRRAPVPEGGTPEAREPAPSDSLEGREARAAVLEAVARLPADQRQVFLLREEAGLSFREIAGIVGCPVNTALGRMHYAMENLRKLMKAYR